MPSDKVLGIDLGTTNSAMAIYEGGHAEILENDLGHRITPSVVRFPDESDPRESPYVGQEAVNGEEKAPQRTVRSIKRDMGDETAAVSIDGDEYRPYQVSAEILRKLKRAAEEKLTTGDDGLSKVAITVPAYFSEDQRQATQSAADAAGFDEFRIINEPTAAALAYGYREEDASKTILVYDLGGGTFDVSIMDIGNGVFDVQATAGNRELGGDDWDQRIVDFLVEACETEHGKNPLEEQPNDDAGGPIRREYKLYRAAKEAKERLSNRRSTTINIPFLFEKDQLHLERSIDRTEFNRMTADLLDQTEEELFTALGDTEYEVQDIDDVILVGGSTLMPQVEDKLSTLFGQKPSRRVDPQEAVAIGAAIEGNGDDHHLSEVTPLTLGIKIRGGVFEPIIDRNTTLPAKETKTFSTSHDNQTSVEVDVYQGEREIAEENRHLGTFFLTGIPPSKKRVPRIDVKFEVDRDGKLTATATDRSSPDRENNITIDGTDEVAEKEVQRYIREAELKEEKDRKRRKIIEAKGEAKDTIDQGVRYLKGSSHVLDDDQQAELQRRIKRVQNALTDDGTTLSELQALTHELNEYLMEVGNQIHTAGQQADHDQPTEADALSDDGFDDVAAGTTPGASDTGHSQPDTETVSAGVGDGVDAGDDGDDLMEAGKNTIFGGNGSEDEDDTQTPSEERPALDSGDSTTEDAATSGADADEEESGSSMEMTPLDEVEEAGQGDSESDVPAGRNKEMDQMAQSNKTEEDYDRPDSSLGPEITLGDADAGESEEELEESLDESTEDIDVSTSDASAADGNDADDGVDEAAEGDTLEPTELDEDREQTADTESSDDSGGSESSATADPWETVSDDEAESGVPDVVEDSDAETDTSDADTTGSTSDDDAGESDDSDTDTEEDDESASESDSDSDDESGDDEQASVLSFDTSG